MKRKKWNKRIVLIAFSWLVLVVASMVFLVRIYYERQKEIVSQTEDQLLTISQLSASNITNYVNNFLSDLEVIRGDARFLQASGNLKTDRKQEAKRQIREILAEYVSVKKSKVADLYLFDRDGTMLSGTSETFQYRLMEGTLRSEAAGSNAFLKGANGKLYLAVSTRAAEGDRLVAVLGIEAMYQKTASFIKAGSKGYTMIKTSSGTILMHPAPVQIGLDVLAGRKKIYPDFDYGELEKLIAHQKSGKSGVEIYHSYWWTDPQPKRVVKISAYTPARLPEGFLIVSTVMDYSEVSRPLWEGMARMLVICFVMVFGIGGFFYAMIEVVRNREKYRRENEYLKKLNNRLQELQEREEQISHNQRLQTIGTLTGGIAHEFNNLLTPIMGYSGMLLQSVPRSEDAYEDIREIYQSSVKAKEIISQISLLSRKKTDTKFRKIALQRTLEEALQVVRSVLPAGVRMETDLRLRNSHVVGSETQLSQVMLNLCTNAIQAMKEKGGLLSVTGTIVESGQVQKTLGERLTDYDAKIVVKDQGLGIDPEVLPRIFDPFFTTKQPGKGTGLGLSIAQSIVENHHGKILVSSRKGAGTAFTVYLPVDEEPVRNPERPEKTAGRPRYGKIAVVDNDRKITRMLKKGLTNAGLSVVSFNSPQRALAYLKANPCDVLLTDYSMPEMLGTELAFSAREIDENLKIVILAGFIDENIMEAKQKRIIDDFLLKPLLCEEILQALDLLYEQ
mgnify:CR=1 FL=1